MRARQGSAGARATRGELARADTARVRSATVDASSSIAVVRRAVGHNLSCLASRCLAHTLRLPPPRPLNFNHLTILAMFPLQ